MTPPAPAARLSCCKSTAPVWFADVVTGKLDVREAAARLPHDSSEEEPMDEDDVIMDNMDGGPFEESRPTEREVTV